MTNQSSKKQRKVTLVIREELQYDEAVDLNTAINNLSKNLPKKLTKEEQKGKIKDAIKELIGDSDFYTNPPPYCGVDQEIDPGE